MTIFQLATVLFVIFAGSRVILRFHEKTIGYGSFFFWSGVWTLVLLAVFRPSLADQVALFLGIRQGADAMFFIAVLLIFYLLFRLYIKLDNIDRSLTNLTLHTSKKIHSLEEAGQNKL